MTTPTNDFMSVTEQRKIEKARKDAARAKKLVAIKAAIDEGYASQEIGFVLIKPYWLKNAAASMVDSYEQHINRAKHMSMDLKDALSVLIVDETGEEDEESFEQFPVANRFAQLTFDVMLDHVFQIRGGGKDGMPHNDFKIGRIYDSLCGVIETELQLMWLAENHKEGYYGYLNIWKNPAYSDEIKEFAKASALALREPFEDIRAYFDGGCGELAEYSPASTVPSFTKEDLLKVAAFLVSHCIASVPKKQAFWTETNVHIRVAGKIKTTVFLTLSESQDVDEVFEQAMKSAHQYGPVDQVTDWNGKDEEEVGGYATNSLSHDMSFVRGQCAESVPGEIVLKCVNNVQSVRYIVNEFTYKTALELNSLAIKDSTRFHIGKFFSRKGFHYSKSLRCQLALTSAAEWLGKSFVSPWNVDYRGRMYPLSSVLTLQSTDFEKSLLLFAESGDATTPSAQRWLSIHVANTFGVDKLSMDQRIAWTKKNVDLIKKVATDPVEHIALWEGASEPWQFIAACREYVECVLGDRKTTNLPVASDATCSGIQVLSGVTLDASAALRVNVLPVKGADEGPQDAYGDVADHVRAHLLAKQDELLEKYEEEDKETFEKFLTPEVIALVDRKVVKKVVMTLAYNSSAGTHYNDIMKALREVKFGGVVEKELQGIFVTLVSSATRVAMEELMPNVIKFKDWMGSASGIMTKLGFIDRVRFTTPSGMQMVQKKMELECVRLKSAFSTQKTDLYLTVRETDVVADGKHRTCTMPNIVHSLDASLLHMAFAEFDKPFGLIHDSVLTTADSMDAAISAYKQAFVDHFKDGAVYETIKNALTHEFTEEEKKDLEGPYGAYRYVTSKNPLPVLPEGDKRLDVEKVIESTYFLS